MRAGSSVASAQAMLDTSKQVAAQPKTAQAMRRGELSAAKAKLVAGAAKVAPEAEDGLLALAKTAPLAEVRKASLQAKASVGIDQLTQGGADSITLFLNCRRLQGGATMKIQFSINCCLSLTTASCFWLSAVCAA